MSANQINRPSSSRLSPLARPFTINRSNSNLSLLSQQNSNSNFTLEGDSITTIPSFHFDVSPTSEYANPSPINGPASCYPQYGLGDFQLPVDVDSDFQVMPINGAIAPPCTVRSPVSNPYDFCSKQGNNPAEGLKLGCETSDHLWTGMWEKDNEIVFGDTKCVSFPTTSELCPGFVFNYPEKNPQFGCSLESNSSAVEVAGPSDTSPCYLPLDLLLLHNLEHDGDDALCNNNPFIYSAVIMEEPNNPLNRKDHEASLKIPIDKNKDGKIGKPIINELMDALAIPESDMQVPGPGLPRDLVLKLPSAEEGEPVEISSKILDDDDSDLDSPCWRGTLAAKQEKFENSAPVDSQLETGTCWKETLAANQKACIDSRTANVHSETASVASDLFSRNDKQSINYYGNECGGDDFSIFLQTASSAVNSLSEEQRSANFVLAKSSSDLRNIIGTHSSNDICSPDKEDDLKNSSSSFFPSFSSMFPSYAENHCKSKLQSLTGPNVAVSVRVNEDEMHHGSTSISSDCRVGVPSFTETHLDANRSFSRTPRLNIQKIVITMNKLSKLLTKNCSNDLDSVNEHESDKMKHIINNLNMCIGNRVGETTLLPDSSHPYASNCLRKSADLEKCSIVDLQATKGKAKKVPHNFQPKNEQEDLFHWLQPSRETP
ncbi:uncharacterized protein [Euphorbia lathyris]|uniref:uncharacterized protein isoform X2 n=1 Tax=Euphorbia lathyris TaxID=212925 RepID=UPI0033137969